MSNFNLFFVEFYWIDILVMCNIINIFLRYTRVKFEVPLILESEILEVLVVSILRVLEPPPNCHCRVKLVSTELRPRL